MYFMCEKNQLYESECNVLYSKIEASKLSGEIEGRYPTILEKTMRLAEFKANPEKKESPYSQITKSFQQTPIFIKPRGDNYSMYDSSACEFFEEPLYKIVGWLADPSTHTVYIAVYQQTKCPKITDISKFPIITTDQYKDLKDGYYWQARPSSVLPYFKQKILLVNNRNFSFDDLVNPKQDNKNQISSYLNTKESTTDSTSTYKKAADIQNLGSYGLDNIELYKSSKSCFIAIHGKNFDKNQGVIFWNPKYPEWLVLYPNETTAINAIKFSRNNQSQLKNEIITNYIVIIKNISYATKGVNIDNKIVRLSNVPISKLKEKLIDANNIIFHFQNSENSSQNQTDFNFGLNGFEKATKEYESQCKDRQ